MYKKFCFFVFLFLLGCGDDHQLKQTPRGEEKNNTGVYFPGGLGIDFGRSPVKDVRHEDNRSKQRDVFFELSESVSRIDRELADVFVSDGYVRRENNSGDYALSVTYRKSRPNGDAYLVLVRYAEFVDKGLEKKVRVRFSWRYDFKSAR